jgi:hypothetical protein
MIGACGSRGENDSVPETSRQQAVLISAGRLAAPDLIDCDDQIVDMPDVVS